VLPRRGREGGGERRWGTEAPSLGGGEGLPEGSGKANPGGRAQRSEGVESPPPIPSLLEPLPSATKGPHRMRAATASRRRGRWGGAWPRLSTSGGGPTAPPPREGGIVRGGRGWEGPRVMRGGRAG